MFDGSSGCLLSATHVLRGQAFTCHQRLKQQQVLHLADTSDDLAELRIDLLYLNSHFGLSHNGVKRGDDASKLVGIHLHIVDEGLSEDN
jgi:hypothetical protein